MGRMGCGAGKGSRRRGSWGASPPGRRGGGPGSPGEGGRRSGRPIAGRCSFLSWGRATMIRTLRLRGTGLMVAGALITTLGAGCGEGGPPVSSSTEKAKGHGTGTVRGRTQTKGTVTFDPSNKSRKMAPMATGQINPDGSYSVETLVGLNGISISTPETEKDMSLQGSLLSCEVKSGDNTFDIVVSPGQ